MPREEDMFLIVKEHELILQHNHPELNSIPAYRTLDNHSIPYFYRYSF
jgi:hypothetical protein